MLTRAWTPLKYVPAQSAFYRSTARYNVAVATRRGGKSDIGRRRKVRKGMVYARGDDGLTCLCAPTRDQAKRLHWEKLLKLIPRKHIGLRNGKTLMVSETELYVRLAHNNYKFQVVGLDKPERAEGDAWDDALLDEVADMKPAAWALSVSPSLSTMGRPGSCDFIGKPRGKGFYFDLYNKAAVREGWDRFHWTAYDVLNPEEIRDAKQRMSPLEFDQEFGAKWVSFEGRAYYCYDEEVHAAYALDYDPKAPLDLCFDFNVKPGTCVVVQPQSQSRMGYRFPDAFDDQIDCVIGEVYIPDNSNTRLVCQRILEAWGHHPGEVRLFGDWSGGSRKTSATEGSDWDQIENLLGPTFEGRLVKMVKPPTSEKDRINALNRRFLSDEDEPRIRCVIDKRMAEQTHMDLENVTCLPDGRLDKNVDPMLTHLTDALGDRMRYLYSEGGVLYQEEL